MIRVTAKFKESFWDKSANAEVPMQSVYMAEALSVEAQKDGIQVQQKFNGHNYGMFLKYKDLAVLMIDDATIEDFKDLDLIESIISAAKAKKYITFAGFDDSEEDREQKKIDDKPMACFLVSESVDEELGEPQDIDITDCFTKDGVKDKVLYMKPIEGYEIREVTTENSEVMVTKVEVVSNGGGGSGSSSDSSSDESGDSSSADEETVEEMLQVTVRGMQGNVVMYVVCTPVPAEIKPEPSGSSSDTSVAD